MSTREPVDLTMDTMDLLVLMAEGNPGALTAMMKLLEYGENGLMCILHLDDMNIRGTQLWSGYSDVCGQDLALFAEYILERNPEMVRIINERMIEQNWHEHVAVERGASFEAHSPRRMI